MTDDSDGEVYIGDPPLAITEDLASCGAQTN